MSQFTLGVCQSAILPDCPAVSQDPLARLRLVFPGFGSGLPPVDQRWQEQYYRYLIGKIVCPFAARYHESVEGLEETVHSVRVLELLDPAKYPSSDGLLCRAMRGDELVTVPLAELEVSPRNPNHQLVEDYWYWFWNASTWRF